MGKNIFSANKIPVREYISIENFAVPHGNPVAGFIVILLLCNLWIGE
jgi:hypothetical protein